MQLKDYIFYAAMVPATILTGQYALKLIDLNKLIKEEAP